MDNSRHCKRKRKDNSSHSSSTGNDAIQTYFPIFHLPDDALSRAFSFLPFNERIAFAMIHPLWQDVQTHHVMKTIITAGQRIRSIDFLIMGDDAASQLTDRDLKHILTSVDAVTNLTSLKLTHCFEIRGHGLQPLSGSRVLERIDLSLVSRHEPPSGEGEKKSGQRHNNLSIEAVLPILHSIVDTARCSLKHIEMPEKWAKNYCPNVSDDPFTCELRRFMDAYNNRITRAVCAVQYERSFQSASVLRYLVQV